MLVYSALLNVGCSSQAKTERHLSRANQFFQAEKYREAVIEYMNVLKVDPTNRVAVRGMAFTLYELGDVRSAIPCLLKAEELDAGDIDVRLKLGTLYLVMGDRSKARERAQSVLKRIPDNLDAMILWGAGVSTSNEVEEAISQMTKYGAKYEGQPRYCVTLASLYVSKGNYVAAEKMYREGLEKCPKSWEIHLARGDLYLRKRDSSRAGVEYQAAADLAPVKSIARVKLARFQWADGKVGEAKKILEDLLKQAGRFSAAALCRAEIALSERDYDTAMKLLEEVSKAEPSNLESFLLMQRVKLAQGKDDEVIAAYEKLVAAFPKSAQGRYLLGVARLHKGDVSKAISECERAVELDVNHVESMRFLAELYIRIGQPDRALALLKSVWSRYSGESFIYVLKGAAYSVKNDFTQAADVYREMIKKIPDSPQGFYLLGLALRRLNQENESIPIFEKALELEPNFMEALEQLVGVMAVRSQSWDSSVKRIEKQIEKVPDAAGNYYLLGNALSQKKDWDQAEKAFLKAIDLKPDIAAAYVGLSYVYIATHREEQALEKLDSALSVNSNSVASLMLKGTLLMNKNDPAHAALQYQRVLVVNPAFVPALNNLACLYQEKLNLEDKAFDCARRARILAPRDSRVADTLGWILFHRGEYKWALTLLRDGLEQLGSEPEVLYHLGMCYAAMGDEENARKSLSRALELAKTFPGSVEATGMLSVLSAGEDLKEFPDVGRVEAFLDAHPDNSYALVKGGAFYERVGEYERARDLYEKAIARNKHFAPALMRLAKLWANQLKQIDRGLVLARQAREENPESPEVADILASIAFRKGDYKWAQSLMMESISRAGGTPARQYMLGILSYALGNMDSATNLVGQVLNSSSGGGAVAAAKEFMERVRHPELAMSRIPMAEMTNSLTVENLPLLMYVAGTYEQKSETHKAQSLYEQAAAQFPDFSPAYKRLALTYNGQRTFSEQEYKLLKKARELLPDDPEVGYILGKAAFSKGQYDWAMRLLQESTVKFPERADGYYYLGMSYHQLKNIPAAKQTLSRAIELDPRSCLATAAQEILRQM
ncbi:MAG: tetratricopeptide repeat protein [bacterium]